MTPELRRFAPGLALALGGLAFAPASQALMFDQDVTNNVIMGSGISNGAWTVDRQQGVELGLRAKQRFPAANVFNSDGAGGYSFAAGNDAGRPLWSFEWSVNTDYDSTSPTGVKLDDLVYRISLDFDASAGTDNFLNFDPINVSFADHSIGDNTTAESAGTEAADATQYAALIADNNLAQNSWRMDFFDGPGFPFDPDADGTYDFLLSAAAPGADVPLASTRISVTVGAGGAVPAPATVALLGIGLLGLGLQQRRRRAYY